jgi:hypothetical protein
MRKRNDEIYQLAKDQALYIYIYIFRVYHIRIIATKKLFHTTWNRQISQ